MLFFELQNKRQLEGESQQRRQVQDSLNITRQDVQTAQTQSLSTKEAIQKLDPKVSMLDRDLGVTASALGSRVADLKDTIRQSATKITSAEIKADQALNNTIGLTSDLQSTRQELQKQIDDVSNTAFDLFNGVKTEEQQTSDRLQNHLSVHDSSLLRFAEAMSGNIKLFADTIAENISAAELNAAAAGTFTRDLTLSLVSEQGEGASLVRYVHPWALLPVIIASEVIADPDIVAPTVKDHDNPEATPQFLVGVLRLIVIFDTDVGVTKTYAPGDTATITIKTSADSKLLGWPVADFVMTYTVIA